MGFTPRLTAPEKTNPLWLRPERGGYNPCIEVWYGTVMPNCVGYVVGRFMEILGTTTCNLKSLNGRE
ncbi:MAG: hypothetical protein NC548_50430, partial [Lachnospiraceae bacterium]|nr:hypothetical protein [Lachnospiraceae bacterium]